MLTLSQYDTPRINRSVVMEHGSEHGNKTHSARSQFKMIRYTCPSCGSGLRIKNRLAGKEVKCPICQKISVAPESSEQLYAKRGEASNRGFKSIGDMESLGANA